MLGDEKMAFRIEEIKRYKTIVVCDNCGKERELSYLDHPLGFDDWMNGALHTGYTFKNEGNGVFQNYCEECKEKLSK
jgi:hypothetical protein